MPNFTKHPHFPHRYIDTNKLLPLLIGALGFIIAIYLESRSFAFGFLLATFVVYSILYHKLWKHILLGLAALATILIIIIIFFKGDSSLGRLLIYKISFRLYAEHWLSGIGLGNFKQRYLYEQAEYFSGKAFTAKEQLLADNTYFAFNDYWQFIIETGIFGMLALSLTCYLIITIIRKAIRTNGYILYKSIAILFLIAILTAALFTHVFEKSIFWIITIFLLSFLFCASSGKNGRRIVFMWISIALLAITGTISLGNYLVNENYEQSLKLYAAGLIGECKKELEKKQPIKEEKRAVLYMQSLMAYHSPEHEKVLVALIRDYPNANNYKLLGDFYTQNNNFKDAEKSYLMAINMVPNRFVSRKALLDLYVAYKSHAKAKRVAEIILSLAIKVDSYQVRKIKLEAAKFLSKTNSL